MAHLGENALLYSNLCAWCCDVATVKCIYCDEVYYCCREHERLHWNSDHKNDCKKTMIHIIPESSNTGQFSTSNMVQTLFDDWDKNNIRTSIEEGIDQLVMSGNMNEEMANQLTMPYSLGEEIHQLTIPSSVSGDINQLTIPSSVSGDINQLTMTSNVTEEMNKLIMPEEIHQLEMPNTLNELMMPINVNEELNKLLLQSNVSEEIGQLTMSSSVNEELNKLIMQSNLREEISQLTMPGNVNEELNKLIASNNVSGEINQLTMSSNENEETNQVAMLSNLNEQINQLSMPTTMYEPSNYNLSAEKPVRISIPDEHHDLISALNSDLQISDNNLLNFMEIEPINIDDASNFDLFLESITQIPAEPEIQSYDNSSASNTHISPAIADYTGIMQNVSLKTVCSTVIKDLNAFGICVLDKFIGLNYGSMIVQEVKSLYSKGIFKKGELINPSPYNSSRRDATRSDVTTWVDGSEPDCKYIGNLIKKLDLVITTCNKMPNNGLLSKYKLHTRTKAVIACYPGDGTYYKKHVDNPYKDGRCITCIYYLNQNWDTKRQGGLLRMFPTALDSQVANIEPIFDRMIFFWSDKRNPHEVLPAYDTRFAITVWYFDADERDKACKRARQKVYKK